MVVRPSNEESSTVVSFVCAFKMLGSHCEAGTVRPSILALAVAVRGAVRFAAGHKSGEAVI